MKLKFALCALMLSASASANAAALPTDDPATAACIQRAVEGFGVPELPIWILLDVERGTLGKVSGNTNGSYDIGPMQINSTWLPRLAKLGVTEDQLLNDLCTNIFVGAWVFAHEYKRFKGDVGKAMAHYHSPTPKHQQRYLGLVQGAIKRRLRAMERAADAPTQVAKAPAPTLPARSYVEPGLKTSSPISVVRAVFQ